MTYGTNTQPRTDYVTISEFNRWLETAKPGDTLVYVTGDLAGSRHTGDALHCLADMAYGLAKANKLHLTQRRLQGRGFEYIATVAHPAGVDQ
jgi:calcineurin-like phosphoesterase family protein